jgi:predicted O-methyltransferase YrrM
MQTAMDAELRRLLEALYEEGERNDAHEQERRRKLLNLEPETAHLLSVLVKNGRRKRLLEIGTSNGYSTIWLAWAAQTTGGRVISIDREAAKQEQAAANLQRAGLRDLVEMCCGDATELVADISGPFDFVFFDADRFSAPAQLKLLIPKLTEDVLLCADNVHSHPDEIAGYLQAIASLSEFEHMIIPVGKGLSLAYRAAANVHKP